MANITIVYKGLTGILGTVTIDDTLTLGDLIIAIAADEGLPTDYYAISIERMPSINDTIYDDSTVTIGGTLPTGAGITADTRIISTPRQDGTKERRQIQKLDIAQLKRQGGPAGDSSVDHPYYRPFNTYDRDLLPAKYVGNLSVDNPNEGGLVIGRPWILVGATGFTLTDESGNTLITESGDILTTENGA
jgi:hypothetical protein